MANSSDLAQADLAELLNVLGMGDHARTQGPHEVFQEALGVLRQRLAEADRADNDCATFAQTVENQEIENANLRAYTPDGDSFWLEIREPGCTPIRKGRWPRRMLTDHLREVMVNWPGAYITVVTLGHDGPQFQDGPEALQMADARSMSTGTRHMRTSREAHSRAEVKAAAESLRNQLAAKGLLYGAGGKP